MWNNIKNRRKSHLADNKRKSLQTGGGVIECTIVENPNIEMVLGNVDYEISAAMDSDTVSVPVHSQLENKRKRYDLPSSSYELEQLAKEEEIEEMLYEATPTVSILFVIIIRCLTYTCSTSMNTVHLFSWMRRRLHHKVVRTKSGIKHAQVPSKSSPNCK